jgi:high-affinity Fe2+/Pb2+ permease
MARRSQVGLVILALVSAVCVTGLDFVAALHGDDAHGLIRIWHYLMIVGAVFLAMSVVIAAVVRRAARAGLMQLPLTPVSIAVLILALLNVVWLPR